VAEIELPLNLPLTLKMQNLGLTPSTLTMDQIRLLNLKDYDHTTSKDDRQKSKLPPIKNNHTRMVGSTDSISSAMGSREKKLSLSTAP
jgi:hypothetical protein